MKKQTEMQALAKKLFRARWLSGSVTYSPENWEPVARAAILFLRPKKKRRAVETQLKESIVSSASVMRRLVELYGSKPNALDSFLEPAPRKHTKQPRWPKSTAKPIKACRIVNGKKVCK
jgi:hypothetical protein